MDVLQSGFWSGIMATSTMSLSMFKMFQHLPQNQKSPLPPANLTRNLAKPVNDMLSNKHKPDLTLFSHYGYGVACGLLYSGLQRYVKASPSVKGGLFGLSVWGASLGIAEERLRNSSHQMLNEDKKLSYNRGLK